MTMRLEVGGVQYENFTAASCEIRLDALSNTFSFEAVAANGVPLPFKGGEACKVIINGETVLTGSIEVVNVSYDAGSHTITVSGRDKTGDLLDSSLNGFKDKRTESITLKRIIELAIEDIGANIEVIDETSPSASELDADQAEFDAAIARGDFAAAIDLIDPPPFNPAEDIVAAEPGENAFDFIEKYSRKRQVLLTSNGNGDIVITNGSGKTAKGSVQHIIGANDNNVLASSFSFDTTGRFNVYKFFSGLNLVAANAAGETSNESSVNQKGRVLDLGIRIGRQLVLSAEASSSDASNTSRAKWERNIRRARGLVYAATVSGHTIAGDLWRINRLYQIVDNFLGKQEPMLTNSVTFTFDLSAGEQTSLGFVDENTYVLDLAKPSTSETASNVI